MASHPSDSLAKLYGVEETEKKPWCSTSCFIRKVLMFWQGNGKWSKLSSLLPLSLVISVMCFKSSQVMKVSVDSSPIFILNYSLSLCLLLSHFFKPCYEFICKYFNMKNVKSGMVLKHLTFSAFFEIPVFAFHNKHLLFPLNVIVPNILSHDLYG